MNLIQLNWFVLTIISCISGSLVSILQKIAFKEKNADPSAFNAYFQFLTGIIIFPIAVLNIGAITYDVNIWAIFILSGFLFASSNVLYFYGFKATEVSKVGILTSTYSIWVLVGGVIFLNEVLTFKKIIGVMLIAIGVITIYWIKNGFKGLGIPQLFIVLYQMVLVILGLIDRYLLNYFSQIATYLFATSIFASICTIIIKPKAIKQIRPLLKPDRGNLLIITSAFLSCLSVFSFFAAMKAGGEISRIGPIWQLSVILTVLLGIIFLKERENYFRKIVGATIVFIGVVFIKLL